MLNLAQQEISHITEITPADTTFLPPGAPPHSGQHGKNNGFRYQTIPQATGVTRDRGFSPIKQSDVCCFIRRTRELFRNRMGNAIDAMGQGGRL